MERDPLSVLVKTSDQIQEMKHDGRIITPSLPEPKVAPRNYEELVRLVAWEAALWNRKDITAEEFAHRFWEVFKKECLTEHKWIHTYLTPMRTKKLSVEEKKERARAAVKQWREKNPDWRRFAREEAKRRKQGGYAIIPAPKEEGNKN